MREELKPYAISLNFARTCQGVGVESELLNQTLADHIPIVRYRGLFEARGSSDQGTREDVLWKRKR